MSLRAYADRIKGVAEGEEVANHAQSFARETLILDPWHDLPLLENKPGALRNGAPFMDWALPESMARVRERLLKQPQGDRAFVELLLAMRDHGTDPVAAHAIWHWRPPLFPPRWRSICRAACRSRSGCLKSSMCRPRSSSSMSRWLIAGAMMICARWPMLTELTPSLKAMHFYGMATALTELQAERPRQPPCRRCGSSA